MRGLPYCIEVFLEIPHDTAWEKFFDVFIFPLLTNMGYKIILLIKYKMIGIVMILIVLMAIRAVLRILTVN